MSYGIPSEDGIHQCKVAAQPFGCAATLPVTFVIAPGLKAVLAFLKYFYYDICTWIALIQNALIFSASVSDDTH